MPDGRKPRLLFLVTEDWYFRSHRLPIARAARDAGYEVLVATRVTDAGAAIIAEGFTLLPLGWRRGGRNPLAELAAILQIARIYRGVRPDIVHHVSMKPVLHGSLAARLAGVPNVVNALTGLGRIFIAPGRKARLFRVAFGLALGWLLNRRGSHLILQNADDAETLRQFGILTRAPVSLIRGSGVDLERFAPTPEPELEAGEPPVALLVARMLWDKGVGELAAASRLLRARGVPLRVLLVGPRDPENPACIPEHQLRAWEAEGLVEWLGPRADIPELLAACHIAVLPSYREGLPKSLLEAAAAGRPLVATDVPGCREICRDGESGLLVPVQDVEGLADALDRLAGDADLRRKLGGGARALAESAFGEDAVVAQTLSLYRGLRLGR